MILATSNITEAIDVAFIDRADIKQFIGEPGAAAVYQILRGTLVELMRANIIYPIESIDLWEDVKEDSKLLAVAQSAVGISGRSLTKLPFLAHARYISKTSATLNEYFDALLDSIKDKKDESLKLNLRPINVEP